MLTTTFSRNTLAIGFVTAALVAAAILLTNTARAASIDTSLDVGSRGGEVTELQAYLATDPTLYPEGLITGYFGSLTRQAVIRFQARYGIDQVGRVGPITRAKLNSLMAGGIPVSGDMNAPFVTESIRESVDNGDNSVELSWSTNEDANARVYYGDNNITVFETSAPRMLPAVTGADNTFFDPSFSDSKRITLEDLDSDTEYNYAVIVTDDVGNATIVAEGSFDTN